jgi:two-component system NarL family response regulator
VVLVLTTYDGDADIYRAVEAGARGYLLKSEFREALLEAIRAVHVGETSLPPEIASRVAARADELPITARELEILTLVAKGLTNPEIGHVLSIAEMTVKNHLARCSRSWTPPTAPRPSRSRSVGGCFATTRDPGRE